MQDRFQGLERRLAAVTYAKEELVAPEDTAYRPVHPAIAQNMALWNELIAPPPKKPAPPKPKARPDLLKRLQGVTASARNQVKLGGNIHAVMIRSAQNQNGRWMYVGDEVNGLVISEITPEAVVFMLEQQGKKYTVELPRK